MGWLGSLRDGPPSWIFFFCWEVCLVGCLCFANGMLNSLLGLVFAWEVFSCNGNLVNLVIWSGPLIFFLLGGFHLLLSRMYESVRRSVSGYWLLACKRPLVWLFVQNMGRLQVVAGLRSLPASQSLPFLLLHSPSNFYCSLIAFAFHLMLLWGLFSVNMPF